MDTEDLVRIFVSHVRMSQAQILFHCQLGQSPSLRTMQESGKGIKQRHSSWLCFDAVNGEIRNQWSLIQRLQIIFLL